MTEYNHWCGNCQIRIYVFRHCGKVLSWQNCQYSCEYGYAMRNSTKTMNDIDPAPTVDAVQVVRCKDCKYYQKVYGGVALGDVGHCICQSFETVPDWYCADGERKDDEI